MRRRRSIWLYTTPACSTTAKTQSHRSTHMLTTRVTYRAHVGGRLAERRPELLRGLAQAQALSKEYRHTESAKVGKQTQRCRTALTG